MEHLIPKIQEIAGKISRAEEKRRKLAGFLKKADSDFPVSCPVEKSPPDGMKIAGVDGGIVKRSVHGFDFVLARAVGVCFFYGKGKVAKVEYYPERIPSPELFALESLSDDEWIQSASIVRQKLEIRMAIETAEKFRPDLLILDGSIIPHYTDKPGKGSKAKEGYEEMILMYKKLFETCEKNGIMLAGVVEDSRGKRFCDIANENIISKMKDSDKREFGKTLENMRDTSLLYWMLAEGERTFIFPYSSATEEHPVIKDFGSFADKIFSFYLKTAKFDRPVRIDFLGEESMAGKIASLILSISSHHSGYGFPSVLIEADQAAKLEENDIEGVYDQILAYTGPLPGISKLRRDNRPF